MEHAVSPNAMGYSTTGIIEQVGEGVTNFAPGDNVVVSAPHAEYSLRPVPEDDPHPQVHHLHPDIPFEEGAVSIRSRRVAPAGHRRLRLPQKIGWPCWGRDWWATW